MGHLHYCICASEQAINIVTVVNKSNLDENKNLDRVLNIFVRANDGGVKLEKADLLLSFMESHQDVFQPNGARKEVRGFVESLNKIELTNPNYNFSKDDVLKASLMISGLDIKYKISNFTSANLLKISNNWENIKLSLLLTVKLLAKYGFTEKTITSKNALLPIAYYIYKNNLKESFIDLISLESKKTREMLVFWLTKAMISGTFGGSSDTVLEKARKLIDENKQFLKIDLVDEESIKDLILRSSYKSVYSDLILKLVTPVNHWGEYEQDHIHPKSKFGNELKNLKLADEEINVFIKKMNSIGNISLLNPRVNNDKRAESLSGWLNDQTPETKDYLLIPPSVSHEFKDFINFVKEREKIIIEKLNFVLGVNRVAVN